MGPVLPTPPQALPLLSVRFGCAALGSGVPAAENSLSVHLSSMDCHLGEDFLSFTFDLENFVLHRVSFQHFKTGRLSCPHAGAGALRWPWGGIPSLSLGLGFSVLLSKKNESYYECFYFSNFLSAVEPFSLNKHSEAHICKLGKGRRLR